MDTYKLYYKSSKIQFLIGVFSSKEDAEYWKDFLAFSIQEFLFESMVIKHIGPVLKDSDK